MLSLRASENCLSNTFISLSYLDNLFLISVISKRSFLLNKFIKLSIWFESIALSTNLEKLIILLPFIFSITFFISSFILSVCGMKSSFNISKIAFVNSGKFWWFAKSILADISFNRDSFNKLVNLTLEFGIYFLSVSLKNFMFITFLSWPSRITTVIILAYTVDLFFNPHWLIVKDIFNKSLSSFFSVLYNFSSLYPSTFFFINLIKSFIVSFGFISSLKTFPSSDLQNITNLFSIFYYKKTFL